MNFYLCISYSWLYRQFTIFYIFINVSCDDLSIHLCSIYLSSFSYLSIYLSIYDYLSIHLFCDYLSINSMSIYSSIRCLSIYLFCVYLSINSVTIYPYILCLAIHLFCVFQSFNSVSIYPYTYSESIYPSILWMSISTWRHQYWQLHPPVQLHRVQVTSQIYHY